MMGIKERHCASLINVSLEELVPADHFYRHLERTLDLSFVRELVQQSYAGAGRPSIDPVVFFKLQLVMFFEGLRSERQLRRHAADRLSVRWYLGYDLGEPLPDHSSLTCIRERYGVDIFRRFFEQIVEQCQQEKLVWDKELYFDGTKVAANAGKESLTPRFAVEAHLVNLFGEETEQRTEEVWRAASQDEPVGQVRRRRPFWCSLLFRSPRKRRRNLLKRMLSATIGLSGSERKIAASLVAVISASLITW
jgi:transposase